MPVIELRRMTDAARQLIVFASGEPVWTTDLHQEWIGDGVTKGGLPAAALSKYGVSQYNADQILSVFDINSLLVLGGANAATITLPASSSVPVGAAISLMSQGAVKTVKSASGDFIGIGPANTVLSFSLGSGDFCKLVNYGNNSWVMESGTPMIREGGSNGLFAGSILLNGWQKLPSGLIIQWGLGIFTGVPGESLQVNYPIAYPGAVISIIISNSSGVGAGGTPSPPVLSAVVTPSLTSFIAEQQTDVSLATYFRWVSLGC